jgi:homoserine/homoserine lactone efflux protein
MALETWFSFFLLSTLAALTPGPAMLLAVTHGARYGMIGTIPTVFGNVSGLAIMMTASAIGIGGLLEASSDWFFALRLVGGLYLIYLGGRLIYTSAGKRRPAYNASPDIENSPRPVYQRYAQGLGVAMSNPKAIFFTAALFPQFIDINLSIWPQLMVLSVTMMTLSFLALTFLATASSKLSSKVGKKFSKFFDRLTGSIFILFGITLIAARR